MKGIKAKIRKIWWLRWTLVTSNWLFQGIRNADRTEKIYKISFSISFTLLFMIVFSLLFSLRIAYNIIISFFAGHTLNWFINGSLSSILSHRLMVLSLTKEKAFNYLQDLQNRLERKNYIETSCVYGSIARGEMSPTSDIDISFVRKPGFKSAIKSILFMVSEKFRTNLGLIPIEPFLADSVDYLKKRYQPGEIPVVIKGDKEILSTHHPETQTLNEAALLNIYKLKDV